MRKVGVLLIGTNGFLGLHILKALLDDTDADVYCLVRGSALEYMDEFKDKFNLFFPDYDLYKERIKLIKGDFYTKNFDLREQDLNEIKERTSMVILVGTYIEQFGKKEDFIKYNSISMENVMTFAYKNQKFMSYVSSMVVCGKYSDSPEKKFSERVLRDEEFCSDNIYIKSKVMAENIFIRYIKKGLKGQLIRVGALTGRESDGVFQTNQFDNAFYAKLKTIIYSGLIPTSLLLYKIEFTPADQCAQAIVRLINNPKGDFSVFHVFNDNYLNFLELIQLLNKLGIVINPVNVNSFQEYKLEVKKLVDSQIVKVGFYLFFKNHLKRKEKNKIVVSCKETKEYLATLGFHWLRVDTIYLKKIIQWME